jgi:hypothetical protein
MARLGSDDNLPKPQDYAQVMIEKKDEIRRLVFGEDNIYRLALLFHYTKPIRKDRLHGKTKNETQEEDREEETRGVSIRTRENCRRKKNKKHSGLLSRSDER